MRTVSVVTLALGLAAGCTAADVAFDRFVENVAVEWVRGDPQGATALQYLSGAEQDALDRELTDVTPRARAARVSRAQVALAELKRFDRSRLDPEQRISAATLAWQLEDIVAGAAFEDTRFVFQQFSGLQVRLVNFLSDVHPIRSPRDAENYLARLSGVAGVMRDGIDEAKRRAAGGYLPPRFILTATIAQFDRFLEAEPSRNVLVTTFAERMAKVADLDAATRERHVAAATRIVGEQIVPAYRNAQRLLREQLPQAKDDAGLWRFPNGAAAYQRALQELTTTRYTPAEVHALGLQEVARIEKEMDAVFRELGYTTGSIVERMDKLNADLQPPADPDPRPALIARYEQILADAQQRAAKVFDLRPQAAIVVKREPAFTEKNASAHYGRPAKDGTRPGVFFAPLPGPTFNIAGMRTLVYHEGVPGHHFQIALQQENTKLPRFRQFSALGHIPAFSEGWALYAEQIAVELGWYADDPRGRLGQLNAELFRAKRLVVDTGIHAMRWTRQQAIDYGIRASEVERYVVWPGQACSYKVGQLKILALRDKARKALGDRFSLSEFHNLVLRTASVPLDVLERVVDEDIAKH